MPVVPGFLTWLRITPEATYGTYNSAGTPWWVRLSGDTAFDPKLAPVRTVIRSADGYNRRRQNISSRYTLGATLKTPFYPTQAQLWLNAAALLTSNNLTSYTFDYFDGIASPPRRYLGGMVGSLGLTASTDAQYAMLNLGLTFQANDDTSLSTTFTQPADTVFPSESPYLLVEATGKFTVGATPVAITQFDSFGLTIANTLTAKFYELPHISFCQWSGRDVDMTTHLTYVDTSWRADYEAQAPVVLAFEFYRSSTKNCQLTFNTVNILTDRSATTPLGGVNEQGLTVAAFYDQSAVTDFGWVAIYSMSASDDTVRLLIDMGVSKENVQAVVKELERLRTGANEVARTYELMAGAGEGYVVAERHVAAAEDAAVLAAMEQTRAQQALNEVLETSATVAGKTASKVAGAGQSLLQSGRVIQDFAQGGITGILNNIEGLAMALGGGAGLAGVLTALGVAAYVAGPQIKVLWANLTEGFRDKVPAATDELGKLTEAIKKNKDELEEMRKHEKLSLIELEKYRDLVAETTKLEEAQQNARAARSVGVYDNKADRARASAFREALGEFGGGVRLVQAMMDAGLDRATAEARVADALKGDKLQIMGVQNRVPAFRGAYEPVSPERAAADDADNERMDAEQADITASGKTIAARRKAAEKKSREDDIAARKDLAQRVKIANEKDHANTVKLDRERADAARKAPDLAATADLNRASPAAAQAYQFRHGGEAAPDFTAGQQQDAVKAFRDMRDAGMGRDEAAFTALSQIAEQARAETIRLQSLRAQYMGFAGRARGQSQTMLDTN